MPAPDYNTALLSEVHLIETRGLWQVQVRYGERLYKLGKWRIYRDAHRACGPTALEKALGSPELRAMHQVVEAEHS